TSWQRVAVAYTTSSSGSTLDFNAFLAAADAPPGNCFYADDASIVTGTTLDRIVISPASATIAAGAAQAYTAQGFDAVGNSLGDVTAATTFPIAPNGSCTGNTCTATALGAHTVTGSDGGKTSTASLTVVAGPLDHLVLSPSAASVTAGNSQSYAAEGFDAFGNSVGDVTASTVFSIAPNGSCSANVCTASSAGAHTVTGTKSGKTGTASLIITAGPLDHLALSPASASITPDGSCTGATCTASTVGAHTVTGTNSGKSANAALQVTTAAVDHIVVAPSTATITAGDSSSFTAEAFDASDNSLGDVTDRTTFSISPNGSCAGTTC